MVRAVFAIDDNLHLSREHRSPRDWLKSHIRTYLGSRFIVRRLNLLGNSTSTSPEVMSQSAVLKVVTSSSVAAATTTSR